MVKSLHPTAEEGERRRYGRNVALWEVYKLHVDPTTQDSLGLKSNVLRAFGPVHWVAERPGSVLITMCNQTGK